MTLPRFTALLLAAWLPAVALASPASVQDANQAFRQGRHTVALEKVNGFLAGSPKDPQGRFLKGLILTELNRAPEAIKVFNDLSDDYPELPEPYNNLAVLYAAQGNYDRAKQSLEMAIRTHPSYATAHENLGDIYAKMASQAYDKALQLDNTNVSAQTKLAMIRDLFSPAPRVQDVVKSKLKVPPKPAAKPVVQPQEPAPAPEVAQPGGKGDEAKSADAVLPAAPAKPPVPDVVKEVVPATPAASGKPAAPAKPSEPVKVAEAPKPPTPPTPPKPPEPAVNVTEPAKAAEPPKPAAPAVQEKKPESAKPAGKRPKDPAASAEYDIRAWAAAWSAQDVDAYLSHYGASFKPAKGKKRAVWEAERRDRISRAQSIKVEVSDLRVTLKGGVVAKAKFRQHYASNLLDNTTTKTLVMKKQGEGWKITEEY
ncbi:MAG: tetratricopeptide repeat protein [Betaproteobacteria bacterium]|nr:tetratricopeptide repeat protein [Betaproteobacteria bacterium]